MPKYCVVVPCYNSAATIHDAVKSAVDLDYSDYSVVVSDNASDDGSALIAASIESPILKVIGNSVVLSKSENWNRAYAQADDCEYYINLHSDDVLNRGVLRYIDRVLTSDSVLVHGSCYRTSFDNKHITKRRNFPFKYSLSGEAQQKSLLFGNSVGIVGTAIKREAFASLGGWSLEYDFYQDVELWYQLASLGRNIYVPKKFGLYRAPEKYNPEKFIDESIRWYEDKIESGLQSGLEKAAINTLKEFVSRNLPPNKDVSASLSEKMQSVLKKYDQYPSYHFSTYIQNNALKLRGALPF